METPRPQESRGVREPSSPSTNNCKEQFREVMSALLANYLALLQRLVTLIGETPPRLLLFSSGVEPHHQITN